MASEGITSSPTLHLRVRCARGIERRIPDVARNELSLLERGRAVWTARLPLHGGEVVWWSRGELVGCHLVQVDGLLLLLVRLRVEELRIQSCRVQEVLVWLRSREKRFVKAAVEADSEVEKVIAALLIKLSS
jgi:hypothetical protein